MIRLVEFEPIEIDVERVQFLHHGTAGLGKHRPGGGGGGGGGTPPTLSFLGQTSWARDALPAGRSVGFSNRTELDNAIAGMQAGDYIHYTGTSPLTLTSSSTTPAYKISSKQPASEVVIDFGQNQAHNYWNTPTNLSSYVAFNNTATSQTSAFVVNNCKNLTIYGGDITCAYGYGVEIDYGDNINMWDQYIHHVGGSGLWVRDYVSGVAGHVRNCTFRQEVNRFCLAPALDSHLDKGTGHHGMILHGNTGEMSGCTFACYAHDPLLPGENDVTGTPQPEGSGGACIEPGNNATGGTAYANNTYYALGVNLLMIPNGTNPGSNGNKQAGGNVIEFWGSAPMNNNIVGWAEGNNCTGGVIHCATGAWDNFDPSTPLIVRHGRYHNVNQYTQNSQSGENSVPFNTAHGIVYQDNAAF